MTHPRRTWALAPAALAGAALAFVHATLLRTDPVADTVLDEAPAAVHLWFSEEIGAAPDPVAVFDPTGKRVDRGGEVNPDDPTELRASVADGGVGTYTLRWRVMSEDGHVIDGTYNYSVVETSTPPTPMEDAGPGSAAMTPLVALGRGVHLFGLTLALGALALALLLGRASPDSSRPIARTGIVGVVVLLAAAPLMLFAQAAAAGGGMSGGFSHEAIAAVMHTPWADFWVVRLVGEVGLAVVALLAARGRALGAGPAAVALAAAGLLLFGTSANGHAFTTDPVWLSVFLDAVHLAATAAWLGGGVCLAVLIAAERRRRGAENALAETLAYATPRFSALALACVQILVVTGLYQTWAHVPSPGLLTSTDYGKALLYKLGLFALIAAPAGINRFVMKPRLVRAGELGAAERASLAGRFGRLMALEGALGGLVVAAAAMLSTLPPAAASAAPVEAAPVMDHAAMMAMMEDMPPAVPARLWSARAADRTVVLSLDPGLIGSNQARVTVHDVDGRVVAPTSVAVRTLAPAESGISPSLVRFEQSGDAYEARLGLGTEGKWELEVVLDDATVATFEVDVTP